MSHPESSQQASFESTQNQDGKLPSAAQIEAVILGAEKPEDHTLASIFRQQPEGANWRLLADVFSIHLRPGNIKEPFGPLCVMDGRRSMIPSDLTKANCEYLTKILSEANDPELLARIGDVLWTAEKNARAAAVAVRGYVASAQRLENIESWPPCMERYERATRLACILGRRGPLLAEVLAHLEQRLVQFYGSDHGYLTHRLLLLLSEFNFGEARALAEIGLRSAKNSHALGVFDMARSYYEVTARLMRRAQDLAAANDAKSAAAETYVEQACAEEARNNFVASVFCWEQAIKAFRALQSGRLRLPELHRRLNAAGAEAAKLMAPIGTEMDISPQVARVRELMSGRGLLDALVAFALLCPALNPTELREQVEENSKEFVLSHMFGATIVDAQGRAIRKIPAMSATDPADKETAVLAAMERDAMLERSFRCHAFFTPALWTILNEHVVEENDLENMLAGSLFIPEGRRDLFVLGFAAGFRRDFVIAIHILIPQIEYALRCMLNNAGVITSNIEVDGAQQEWPLGQVLAASQLPNLIGPDLIFEFRGLLNDKGGANLRNRMAHGMMSADEFNSSASFYLWWLALHICVIGTAAHANLSNQPTESADTSNASDDRPEPD